MDALASTIRTSVRHNLETRPTLMGSDLLVACVYLGKRRFRSGSNTAAPLGANRSTHLHEYAQRKDENGERTQRLHRPFPRTLFLAPRLLLSLEHC